jgi:hypothetical protein
MVYLVIYFTSIQSTTRRITRRPRQQWGWIGNTNGKNWTIGIVGRTSVCHWNSASTSSIGTKIGTYYSIYICL